MEMIFSKSLKGAIAQGLKALDMQLNNIYCTGKVPEFVDTLENHKQLAYYKGMRKMLNIIIPSYYSVEIVEDHHEIVMKNKR